MSVCDAFLWFADVRENSLQPNNVFSSPDKENAQRMVIVYNHTQGLVLIFHHATIFIIKRCMFGLIIPLLICVCFCLLCN